MYNVLISDSNGIISLWGILLYIWQYEIVSKEDHLKRLIYITQNLLENPMSNYNVLHGFNLAACNIIRPIQGVSMCFQHIEDVTVYFNLNLS